MKKHNKSIFFLVFLLLFVLYLLIVNRPPPSLPPLPTPEETLENWRKSLDKNNPESLFWVGTNLYYFRLSTKEEGIQYIHQAADLGMGSAKDWLKEHATGSVVSE